MSGQTGRILVVDDDFINRTLLQTSLQNQGYEVETGEDGREALEKLSAEAFDVILLDLLMPEIDGYEVLQRVKRDESLRRIPVIIISALDEMDSVVRCIEMGATDYLPKPFDPVLLRARIRASLVDKRLRDMKERYLAEIEELANQLKIRNRFIRKTFGRFLSDEIVASLLDSPDGIKVGGEKRRVTILMADLRGFSAICERLAPEKVVALLNNYLGKMADVILAHNGTIDEFIGDAVLGLFGAITRRDDDARRALCCAIEMQQAMCHVNETNLELGLPLVEMGVGVNTGEVVVGNIGSDKRLKYGVVGSHVNLTGRIESYTVGGQILVSDATLRQVGAEAHVGASFTIRAKGFPEPIQVHDLIGLGDLRCPAAADLEMVDLDPGVPVTFTIFEGKHIGETSHEGKLIRLSRRCADLRTPAPIQATRKNIKIHWFDARGRVLSNELYGKCQAAIPAKGHGSVYRIRFTSVPSVADEAIDALLKRKGLGGERR